MSPKTIIALLLILLGIAAFAYQGINYTTRENPVNIGPMHVTIEKSHHIPLPPVAGALALGAGIILMLVNPRRFTPAGARS